MRLTIYGRSVVVKALIVTLLLDIAALLIPDIYLKTALLIFSVMLFSFVLYFFRDPVRTLPDAFTQNCVLSPADGKVMMISDILHDTYLDSKAKQVGIFLSPLDVHVNRFPVSGVVDYFEYIKGNYVVAFNHKSSELNERTLIGINTGRFKVMFKQVAGFVARRIVCELKTGDKVKAGEKFGMIKFGSRVDLILPESSVIKVKVQEKVVGGETIIAEVPV